MPKHSGANVYTHVWKMYYYAVVYNVGTVAMSMLMYLSKPYSMYTGRGWSITYLYLDREHSTNIMVRSRIVLSLIIVMLLSYHILL